MAKKIITGRRVFLILSAISPLIYILMYLPIWHGKELNLSNGALILTFFIFQCISFLLALLRLYFDFAAPERENVIISFILDCVTVISVIITCFAGYFFTLNLFDFPVMPAQR